MFVSPIRFGMAASFERPKDTIQPPPDPIVYKGRNTGRNIYLTGPQKVSLKQMLRKRYQQKGTSSDLNKFLQDTPFDKLPRAVRHKLDAYERMALGVSRDVSRTLAASENSQKNTTVLTREERVWQAWAENGYGGGGNNTTSAAPKNSETPQSNSTAASAYIFTEKRSGIPLGLNARQTLEQNRLNSES